MSKLIKLSIILLLIFNVFSIGIISLQAADLQGPTQSGATLDTVPSGFLPTPTGPTAGCPSGSNCGNYTLNDMVRVALIVSEFILSIVGSLALIAFIAGGLMWLISAGNPELVTRGKQTILGAVIGLAVVFTSYMIIQLVFSGLGIPDTGAGQWATSAWNKAWK